MTNVFARRSATLNLRLQANIDFTKFGIGVILNTEEADRSLYIMAGPLLLSVQVM